MEHTAIIEELRLRAWQERASAKIRPSKPKTAAHEHAAHALESLANDLESGRIATQRADDEEDNDPFNFIKEGIC